MGFLDKLRLSGNDREQPPQPPSIKEPTPPKTTMQLDTPPPLNDMPPLNAPSSLNAPDDLDAKQSLVGSPELTLPEQPLHETSLQEQESVDEIPSLKPIVPQEEQNKKMILGAVPPRLIPSSSWTIMKSNK